MEFRKYNSIENSYRKEFVEKIIREGFLNEQFIVQEKAHGANLSFWTNDGVNFTTAKRTSFLEQDETFYNYRIVLESLKPKLEVLWNKINEKLKVTSLAVFGEIIGGLYPHEEVQKVKSAMKVQKGVFYCPQNDFYAFDILINNEYYLEVAFTNSLFEELGIVYAKTLFSGNLEEVLEYPNIFSSVVYQNFDLPEIKENICEGVIIRPNNFLCFNNGQRVLLKNKNEKWAEKEKRPKREKKVEDFSEPVLELQSEIALYVTENRLNNVISKVGEITPKDFGKLMGMFSNDIIDDFSKDNSALLVDFDKKEYKQITKSINKKVLELVKIKVLS